MDLNHPYWTTPGATEEEELNRRALMKEGWSAAPDISLRVKLGPNNIVEIAPNTERLPPDEEGTNFPEELEIGDLPLEMVFDEGVTIQQIVTE